MKNVLQRWSKEAQKGKNSSYKEWTFFDTNCLSELVKIAKAGNAKYVQNFVKGLDIIIPGTVLQELRHKPEIATQIPNALTTAKLYLLSHPTSFWKCDLWNFINIEGDQRNVLDTYQIPPNMFGLLDLYPPFIEACKRSEEKVKTRFFSQIARDLQEINNERELGAIIWHKINNHDSDRANIEIPVCDCRPINFPSFFVYYYSYYFKYLKNKYVKPELNDFIDLAQTIIAPYCQAFYTERSLAMLLRNEVQGRVPPNPHAISKYMFKKGYLDKTIYDKVRHLEDMKEPNSKLLSHTLIYTFSEMREKIFSC